MCFVQVATLANKEKDAATQTGTKRKTAEEELEVIKPKHFFWPKCCVSIFVQVATLANKFLHAAYWYLVLGVTFSSKQLEGLARVARTVQGNNGN